MEAFFLPTASGRRFCIYHPPAAATVPRGGIVHVHAFGEEMNKARRMVALQARRAARAGWGVLLLDLAGCGDSDGEFADARWQLWQEDVLAAATWVRERTAGALCLWGLRLGATLAAQLAADPRHGVQRAVLWQPIASGEQFMTQFLRLHLAAEMLAAGAAQTGVRELREQLAAGRMLEIAGYELHPELAQAVDALRLAPLAPAGVQVTWLEVSAQETARLTPASQRVVEGWQAARVNVTATAVSGEAFWSTIEIAECPALLDATDAALSG